MKIQNIYDTEKNYTLLMYRAENGKIISVVPQIEEYQNCDNVYSMADIEEAKVLRDLSRTFFRLPILCTFCGRPTAVIRSMCNEFDIGILFIFDAPLGCLLKLVGEGKLELLAVNKGLNVDKKLSNQACVQNEDNYIKTFNAIRDGFYGFDIGNDILTVIRNLSYIAGCNVNILGEDDKIRINMEEEDEARLSVILFMNFVFAAREDIKREIAVSIVDSDNGPLIGLTTELRATDGPRHDAEIYECIRISDERHMVFEGETEKTGSKEGAAGRRLKINFCPICRDPSLLGIKHRIQLDD